MARSRVETDVKERLAQFAPAAQTREPEYQQRRKEYPVLVALCERIGPQDVPAVGAQNEPREGPFVDIRYVDGVPIDECERERGHDARCDDNRYEPEDRGPT
jgi:hypothetical protein